MARSIAIAAAVAAITAAAAPARAVDVEWNSQLSNRFEFKRNFLDSSDMTKLKFDQQGKGYYFYGTGGVDLDGGSWSFTLTLDTGIIKVPQLYPQSPSVNEVTMNDKPFADEAKKTLFVRELYLDADLALDGALTLKAGKYQSSIGKDYIYNDYTLGARASIDLSDGKRIPFRSSLEAVTADGTFSADGKRSPVVSAEAAYVFGKGEEAGLLFAWFHDGDNNVGEIMKPFVSEFVQDKVIAAAKHQKQSGKLSANLVKSIAYIERQCGGNLSNCMQVADTADLFWTGVFANKIFGSWTLGGVALVNAGTANLDPYLVAGGQEYHLYEKQVTKTLKGKQVTQTAQTSPADKTVLAGMADVDAAWEFVKGYSLNAFFLFLSGDDNLEKINSTRLTSFIAVLPYITKTDIFFNGGINETASARTLSTSGINAHGVLAPGVGATLEPIADVLEFKLGWAMLLAQSVDPQASPSRVYGWEVDASADWTATSWLDVMLEFDFFKTGAFFEHREDYDPYGSAPIVKEPNPIKVLLGVDVHYN